jgi:integrase
MPKKVAPLSVRKIETAKPGKKSLSLFDGDGLYLFISPIKFSSEGKPLPASKLWRFKYRYGGRACLLSFGAYPAVGLDAARIKRQEARALLARGINPSSERKAAANAAKAARQVEDSVFSVVARQWLDVASTEWTEGHARTVRSRLERDILPMLGDMPMPEITTKDVLASLRLVEARQAFESAHRIKTIISQIFTFAIISDVAGVVNNPAAGLARVLKQPKTRSMAAILDSGTLARLLVDIDRYTGSFVVRCALQLAPMLFVRPGELRHAEWKDIDLDKAVWQIPIENMKFTLKEKSRRKGQVHTVPLARQAVAVLALLHRFTGAGAYVFPGRAASRVMSGNTVNHALRTLGWGPETVTGHGFRATARTMLHETLRFSPDAIEAQLGHAVPDRLGTAYNRTKHIEERTRMMQAWADYLEQLTGREVAVSQWSMAK